MSEWHYERNGERLGGVSKEEIGALIAQRVINGQTLVWKQDFTGWMPLQNTELATYLTATTIPPALPSSHINSVWIWLLAAAPLIGLILEGFVSGLFASSEYAMEKAMSQNKYWYVTVILNIGLSVFDEKRLKKAGVDTTSFGKMVFLVPVYLWQRAHALNQRPTYFWTWIGAFVISLFV